MKKIFGWKCWGLIRLLILALLVITVPAGLVLGASPANLPGNPVIKTVMAVQDNQIALLDYHEANIKENNNYSPDIDNTVLYNEHIQDWIFIVLVVLGTYILIVGIIIYSFVRRINSK